MQTHSARTIGPGRSLVVAAICLLSLTPLAAMGQPAEGPSVEDIQAAANAFAEAQRAQLRGEYAHAAELFELANDSAPSAEALRSVIRNRRASGAYAQAATAALDAMTRYPSDATSVQLANEILTELGGRLGLLQLVCEPACVATVDGRSMGRVAFTRRGLFVDPGDHAVRAEWPDHPATERTVAAVAGQTHELRLERPAAPEPPAAIEQPPPDEPEPVAAPPGDRPGPQRWPPRRAGLPPTAVWIGTGLTAIATGLAIWSGTDTLSARDVYEGAPTRAGYEDGVGLELRTNLLIATSAALGAATIAIALFATDWAPESPTPVVAVGRDGATIGIRGEL